MRPKICKITSEGDSVFSEYHNLLTVEDSSSAKLKHNIVTWPHNFLTFFICRLLVSCKDEDSRSTLSHKLCYLNADRTALVSLAAWFREGMHQ